MPKKAFLKRKAWKRACYQKAQQGLWNKADGTWERVPSAASGGGMAAGYRAGYRLGSG